MRDREKFFLKNYSIEIKCDYILFYDQSKFLSLNFKKKISFFFSVFENFVIREEQVLESF